MQTEKYDFALVYIGKHWETLGSLKRERPAALADCRLPPCDSIACLDVIVFVESHHDWLNACCRVVIMVHTSPSSSP